jgi:hypothetical protein
MNFAALVSAIFLRLSRALALNLHCTKMEAMKFRLLKRDRAGGWLLARSLDEN